MNFKRGLIRLCTVASVLYMVAVSAIGADSFINSLNVLISDLPDKRPSWSFVGTDNGASNYKINMPGGKVYEVAVEGSFKNLSLVEREKTKNEIIIKLRGGKKLIDWREARYELARRKIREFSALISIPVALLWAFLFASFWIARGFTEKGKI